MTSQKKCSCAISLYSALEGRYKWNIGWPKHAQSCHYKNKRKRDLTLQCILGSCSMSWTLKINKTKYQWITPRLQKIPVKKPTNEYNIIFLIFKETYLSWFLANKSDFLVANKRTENICTSKLRRMNFQWKLKNTKLRGTKSKDTSYFPSRAVCW